MPLSLLPLSAISWQRAFYHVFLEKVSVLKEYDYWTVSSQHMNMKVPSIIIMKKQVKFQKVLKYSRGNVFLRDDFTCQLQLSNRCKERKGKCKSSELTLDHVLPKSKTGKTEWANVCTSCKECNTIKGNDQTILPIRIPKKPDYYELLKKRKAMPIYIRDEEWRYYLDWPVDFIRVIPQPGMIQSKDQE